MMWQCVCVCACVSCVCDRERESVNSDEENLASTKSKQGDSVLVSKRQAWSVMLVQKAMCPVHFVEDF